MGIWQVCYRVSLWLMCPVKQPWWRQMFPPDCFLGRLLHPIPPTPDPEKSWSYTGSQAWVNSCRELRALTRSQADWLMVIKRSLPDIWSASTQSSETNGSGSHNSLLLTPLLPGVTGLASGRGRTAFTHHQPLELEELQLCRACPRRQELTAGRKLSDHQVKIRFQNRMMR